LKITVAYLYPEVMNTYGDRGNVQTIVRRCAWRGITAQVRELRIGDPMQADDTDLIMIGNGGECGQALISSDLVSMKGQPIKDAVARGAAALAVGGGYELFGQYCRPSEGEDLTGIGLFDAWTVRNGADLVSERRSITAARADRAIGDLVVQWGSQTLVGFENHGGRTYLGPTAKALGSVVVGHGNNGDGTEGVQLGNAIGTYLRGPCLPRNPVLADFLISAAVACRYGAPDAADLLALPDDLEMTAHDVAVERVLGNHGGHRAWFSRIGLGRLRPGSRPGSRHGRRPAPALPLAERAVTNPVPAQETLQAGS
jgi:lipid II isoglutaminyl synthase (glutamine-hydrolysing)